MKSSLKTSSLNLLRHWKKKFSSLDIKHISHDQPDLILYQEHNIDDCPWPRTAEGEYAKAFLTPLVKKGVSQYIENIKTDIRVLVLGELVLPVTINEAEYDNSYVCSPYSYYISYARESLDLLPKAWLYYPMNGILIALGRIFRKFRFNKVIIVNNWLFSTNLYPQVQSEQLIKISTFLQHSFPDHAIIFRSVDPCTNPVCYQTLQRAGFDYIATRQIFFLNPRHSTLFESRIFKSDLKLLTNSDYQVIDGKDLKEEELPRLLELYRDLYIGKYSTLNPRYNVEFLKLMLKENLMHFKALKKDGCIDGVVGFVERNGKMYCPFFGYDRHVPKEAALYRILCTILMLEANERNLFFHQSSGASMFKKIRKAHDCIEYTAVSYRHLKVQRHLPWMMLKNLYNSIGAVYMKRY